jgi:hypothetical protein
MKEYCDALSTELSVWKDELYDIVKVMNNLPERDRELMAPQLSSVRLLIEKIGKEIDRSARLTGRP